ncbi:hypothetical protein LINGRAHAP2_LOCUS22804 [Linum grandiflorum]
MLEEENGKLGGGFPTGIQPEGDDLVRVLSHMRLPMEALPTEKSRLANKNTNRKRIFCFVVENLNITKKGYKVEEEKGERLG